MDLQIQFQTSLYYPYSSTSSIRYAIKCGKNREKVIMIVVSAIVIYRMAMQILTVQQRILHAQYTCRSE